jgi:hypothetical protein
LAGSCGVIASEVNDQVAVALVRSGALIVDTATGQIWTTQWGKAPRLLSSNPHGRYVRNMVAFQGHEYTLCAHRIVWIAAHGTIDSSLSIDHIDGNKTNNAISNLRLVTIQENDAAARRLGLQPIGGRHGMAKLTDARVIEVFRLCNEGLTQRDIAKRFGVSFNQIWRITSGRQRKDLTGQLLSRE